MCWVLHQLLKLDLHAYEYDPLRASTYIPLPKELQDKHAVVNIQNNDDKCFIWCVSAAVYGDPDAPNLQRVSHYREHESKWDAKGISMRVRLRTHPLTLAMSRGVNKAGGAATLHEVRSSP